MTAASSARGPRGARRAPGRVHRADPARGCAAAARPRSPPTSCRWALLGFPGVGWLFAGFPLTGDVLLLAGPAFAWAVLPLAFTPFGDGPLRGDRLAGRVRLAAAAARSVRGARSTARTGAGARASSARRPATAGGTGGRARCRTRIGVAAGTIALLLVSLPFVPAVGGHRQRRRPLLLPAAPHRARSRASSSRTPRGPVKLFAWSDPQEPYPRDALRVHAARRPRAARPRRGRRRAGRLPALRPRPRRRGAARGARRARDALARARRRGGRCGPAATCFIAVARGHVRRSRLRLPRRSSRRARRRRRSRAARTAARPRSPTPCSPVAAALLALAFALLLLRSLPRAAGRPEGALGASASSSSPSPTAARRSPSARAGRPALFRTYYLCGGVLDRRLPRRRLRLAAAAARAARDVLLGALAVATRRGRDHRRPRPGRRRGARARRRAAARRPTARSAATRSSGRSRSTRSARCALRRRLAVLDRAPPARPRRTSGSPAARWSSPWPPASRAPATTRFVYLGELAGIALMFCGFTLPSRAPAPRRQPQPHAAQPATTAQ